MPASPLEFSGASRTEARRAPLLGENTDEVLADVLKLSSGEIGRLHDEGVVSGPAPLLQAAAHRRPRDLSEDRDRR